MSKQLQEPQPKKPVLTSLWEGLLRTLPDLAKIAEAAGGISKLFA